ncbi:hypothetical protein LguiA_022943 [Lonicera macranthoides]
MITGSGRVFYWWGGKTEECLWSVWKTSLYTKNIDLSSNDRKDSIFIFYNKYKRLVCVKIIGDSMQNTSKFRYKFEQVDDGAPIKCIIPS